MLSDQPQNLKITSPQKGGEKGTKTESESTIDQPIIERNTPQKRRDPNGEEQNWQKK